MAFTDPEKLKIVRVLGYSAKTLDEDSTSYNSTVNDRLTGLTDETLGAARDLLNRMDSLDDQLAKAIKRAGIKKVGDIEFDGNQLYLLRNERYKLLRELGQLLDLDLKAGGGAMVSVCV